MIKLYGLSTLHGVAVTINRHLQRQRRVIGAQQGSTQSLRR